MGKGTRSVVPTRVLSTELIATYGAVPGRCPEQSKHRSFVRTTSPQRARKALGRDIRLAVRVKTVQRQRRARRDAMFEAHHLLRLRLLPPRRPRRLGFR